jgi:2-dehydropantoate 2-reductase
MSIGRVAILGAGAMGSVFGGLLTEAGTETVLLTIDDAHIDAVNGHGLKLDLLEGRRIVYPRAMRPEAFRGPVDLIVLFTKTHASVAALTSIRDELGGAYVLTVQNGLGNGARVAQFVPSSLVMHGTTMMPADLIGPGHVSSHGERELAFYSFDGQERAALGDVVSLFAPAAIHAVIDADVATTIWEKASFNCALNAMGALTGATPGVYAASPEGLSLANAVAEEACAIGVMTGAAPSFDRVRARIELAVGQHPHHKPSMLQDIESGQRTEIEALNGEVVRLAVANGRKAPLNAMLCDLVRLAEASAVFKAPKAS